VPHQRAHVVGDRHVLEPRSDELLAIGGSDELLAFERQQAEPLDLAARAARVFLLPRDELLLELVVHPAHGQNVTNRPIAGKLLASRAGVQRFIVPPMIVLSGGFIPEAISGKQLAGLSLLCAGMMLVLDRGH
jgi:hypothetical protein